MRGNRCLPTDPYSAYPCEHDSAHGGKKGKGAVYLQYQALYGRCAGAYAQKDAALFGEYCSVMQLDGIAKSSNPGGFMFSSFCRRLEGRAQALRKACEALGGTPFPIGEVAYQLPLFDFLPIVVQFWDADEDFPGQLMIKWDRNILQYMHFETTFYATGCLLQRILELMDT